MSQDVRLERSSIIICNGVVRRSNWTNFVSEKAFNPDYGVLNTDYRQQEQGHEVK